MNARCSPHSSQGAGVQTGPCWVVCSGSSKATVKIWPGWTLAAFCGCLLDSFPYSCSAHCVLLFLPNQPELRGDLRPFFKGLFAHLPRRIMWFGTLTTPAKSLLLAGLMSVTTHPQEFPAPTRSQVLLMHYTPRARVPSSPCWLPGDFLIEWICHVFCTVVDC